MTYDPHKDLDMIPQLERYSSQHHSIRALPAGSSLEDIDIVAHTSISSFHARDLLGAISVAPLYRHFLLAFIICMVRDRTVKNSNLSETTVLLELFFLLACCSLLQTL